MLDRAILLAVKAHLGQTDWADKPYILHPMRIMLRMGTEAEQTIAILHDVIEDSDMTLEDLEKEGFPPQVMKALDAITRRKDEDYELYIERVAGNYLARKIKLVDLEDNMNPRRFHGVFDERGARLMARYVKAFARLSGV